MEEDKDEIVQLKEIYKKRIVYSTSFKSQGDHINDVYLRDGRKSGRHIKESLIIVDEVDNMFIDKGLQSCLL